MSPSSSNSQTERKTSYSSRSCRKLRSFCKKSAGGGGPGKESQAKLFSRPQVVVDRKPLGPKQRNHVLSDLRKVLLQEQECWQHSGRSHSSIHIPVPISHFFFPLVGAHMTTQGGHEPCFSVGGMVLRERGDPAPGEKNPSTKRGKFFQGLQKVATIVFSGEFFFPPK